VGAIVRESQTSTNRNYEVDDGTGVIQVRIWIESDDNSDHIAKQLGNVGYIPPFRFTHTPPPLMCNHKGWKICKSSGAIESISKFRKEHGCV
jgi:hypothetical protein